jgi:DNA-binding PadR family transcriptional regulator
MTNASYAIDAFQPVARRHKGRRGAKAAALLAMAAGHHRGHGRRGRGFGHGGNFPFMMPFGGGPFGPGGPFGRGPKARRGDVRTAALLLLNEGPRNGYQIMQDIEERSGGVWRPSPGSVYPALQQLEDEGLVRATEAGGRKQFELTDAGRDYVAERGSDLPTPWDEMKGGFSDEAIEAGNLMREVGLAFMQVLRAGSPSQIAEASKVLTDTRRSLYRILAEGDPTEGDPTEGDPTEGDAS